MKLPAEAHMDGSRNDASQKATQCGKVPIRQIPMRQRQRQCKAPEISVTFFPMAGQLGNSREEGA
eukprot:6199429-Pleurochrysis_carterae.AAC.3